VKALELLLISSQQLLQHLEECKKRFEQLNEKPEKTEEYFYDDVKPYFELVMNKANEWKPLAVKWVSEYKPKYIHLTQIDSAMENIEQVVLQSFYKDVNKQRFHNLHHSVEYILNGMIEQMDRKDASK